MQVATIHRAEPCGVATRSIGRGLAKTGDLPSKACIAYAAGEPDRSLETAPAKAILRMRV